jgi:exonuclease III
VLVALLLLLGGVEQNPGPAAGYSGDIQFGSININSAVHRAPLVHTTIADLKMDLLALQETKIDINDPLAIKADVAPEGYGVLHAHRPSSKDTRGRVIRGVGLAIVYHHGLDVKAYRPQSVKTPTTFEHQLVDVKAGK